MLIRAQNLYRRTGSTTPGERINGILQAALFRSPDFEALAIGPENIVVRGSQDVLTGLGHL